MWLRVLIFMVLLCGCAGKRNLENDLNDPRYHSGQYSPFPNSPQSSVAGEAAVAAAAIVGGLNTGYYEKSTIHGKCTLLADKSDRLGVPCMNFTLQLVNSRGVSIHQTQTDQQGNFRFFVENEPIEYTLQCSAPQTTLVKRIPPFLKRGESTEIFLMRKSR